MRFTAPLAPPRMNFLPGISELGTNSKVGLRIDTSVSIDRGRCETHDRMPLSALAA